MKAKDRWNKKTYDQVNIRFPKGQKDRLRELADSENISLNEFIVRKFAFDFKEKTAVSPP